VDVVAAGDVSLTGLVDLRSGEDGGGTLFIDSGGAVTLGELRLDGQGELGDGGTLDVTGESATLTGPIQALGSSSLELCGDGGDLTVDVTGLLDISGNINVNSKRDCLGGLLDFSAGVAILRNEITFRGEGIEGAAGFMSLFATERIECLSTATRAIDGRGNDGGGQVSFEVDGLDAGTETSVNCNMDLAGPGGSFDIDTNTNLSIGRMITAGGSGASGGLTPVISIEGCTVRVGSAASLTSLGSSATNVIVAHEQTNVAGAMRAVTANEFRFRPGLQPIVTGQVVPGPRLVPEESLPSCGFATGTPTITRTATVTRTPTPTDTPSLLCVGDCNEDGVVSVDELVLGLDIGLGTAALSECVALDRDQNGQVDISENITAVSNSLNNCSFVF
jgi:hypothetical protein